MTINWGIIGCGNVTEVKSGPAFNKVADSVLKAVMRRNAEKARDYAQRHGVPKWYNDGEQLINDPEINAIYVATPPSSHEEYTIAALKARKPVYVEKPAALSAESAARMYNASLEYNTPLTIAHYRRGLPVFKKIKELLNQKVVGEIRFVNMRLLQSHNPGMIAKTEENWRLNPSVSGGGLFHDLAPHQLDLMIWFFGKVKHAEGLALNRSGVYPADDFVSGSLLFENGIPFNGLWSFNVPDKFSEDLVEITGTEGRLSFSVFGNYYFIEGNDGTEKRVEFKMPQHIQQPMISEVVQYFLGRSDNPCSGQDGVDVMKIIDSFSGRKNSSSSGSTTR